MSRRKRFLIVLSTLVLAHSLRGQPAYRVKDIDPRGNSTWPSSLTVAGDRLYFMADDGPDGRELWTSDGTGPGTTRVPGTAGIWSVFTGNVGAYFFKGSGATDLWKSDGTEEGTSLVKAGVGIATESAVAGALTFFSNSRLWRTDGTLTGTYQLFGNDGQEPVNVQQLVSSGNVLYFFAAGESHVDTLWRSDGTSTGTFAVPASPVTVLLPSYSYPRPMLAAFGNSVFFGAQDAAHGSEPWISDGTDAGTALFRDLDPGPGYSNPQQFTLAGSRLFFGAFKAGLGWRLWSTDGSPSNASVVESLIPGWISAGTPMFSNLTAVTGRLAFRTMGDYGVWTSDGTDAGTVRLRAGDAGSLVAAGPRLFFTAPLGELWVSDLTPAGTRLVKSFGSSVQPTFLREFGGFLYFFADDGVVGPQLWKSDGTAAGTNLVRIVHPGFLSSNPTWFLEAAGMLFFQADANATPGRLWKSDGTEPGTVVVSDLSGDFAVSLGRRLHFPGPGVGQPLWETDGSSVGTVRIAGQPDGLKVQDRHLVASGDRSFWIAQLGSGDPELWVAEPGPPSAARKISSYRFVSDLVDTPEGAMFGAASTDVTYDLWRSDGTAAGTRVAHEFHSFQPILIQRAGARHFVLVSARTLDPFESRQLWVTDGTEAGTALVWDSGPRSGGGIFFAGSMQGKALFRVSNPAGDQELWRSDGTTAGTFVLHTFAGPFAALGPITMTFDGAFFPVSPDGIWFRQLWGTNGSVSGTRLVRDFSDLAASYVPPIGKLLDVAGSLVFGLRADVGEQLWSSDGSTQGTKLFQTGVSAETPIYYLPGPGLAVGNRVFFAGYDRFAGTELWALPLSAAFVPKSTSFSLLSPCRLIDTRQARGFLGGPALSAGAPRVFPVGGVCGIPWTARSIGANVTVTNATSDGVLRIHASDIGAPDAAAINFRAGQTRANNVMISLGPDGDFTVRFEAPTGTAHVIVDIVGFFE